MKKTIKSLSVLLILLSLSFNFNSVYAAGSADSGNNDEPNLYKVGKNTITGLF